MRPRILYALVALVASSFALLAAPPEVPPKVEGKVGKPVLFDVKIDKGKEIGWSRGFDMNACVVVRLHSDDPTVMSFMGLPSEPGDFYLTFWTIGAGEKGHSQTVLKIGGVKPDDDVIPTPKPKPDDPPTPIDPLKSFRVMLIYESGDLQNPDHRAVIYGKVVESWLNANCTGGKSGWVRRDKDAPAGTDTLMAPIWNAIRPSITGTPCVAVERNNKITLIDLEPTPTKMVEVLQAYRGK